MMFLHYDLSAAKKSNTKNHKNHTELQIRYMLEINVN
jgi:hypothetical protein